MQLRWLYDESKFRRFGDVFRWFFFILYSECPPYFYFRFVWLTDIESIPHASTQTSIIPTKFEAPTPIRSWVMSDKVSHWLPLKMRTRPLRMRRITWPVSRGQKQLHIWNPRPRFAFLLYKFYWATTTIKGRLLSSVTNAKALDSVNFFVHDLVTLTFDLLTLNSCRTWRVTWLT